jgi:hypothetical protein
MGFALINPRAKLILIRVPRSELIGLLALLVCGLCSGLFSRYLGFGVMGFALVDPGPEFVRIRVPRSELIGFLALLVSGLCSRFFRCNLSLSMVCFALIYPGAELIFVGVPGPEFVGLLALSVLLRLCSIFSRYLSLYQTLVKGLGYCHVPWFSTYFGMVSGDDITRNVPSERSEGTLRGIVSAIRIQYGM